MITRRSLVAGLIAAPAVVKADNLMKVYSLPQRYATVWGIGHDLEVIEHVLWEPISVGAFGGTPAIDKFREVTEWEWGFPVEPIPAPQKTLRRGYAIDPLARFRVPEGTFDGPFIPAGYTPPMYLLAKDMGPSAQTGIWDPNRAKKDDLAANGYNLHERGQPIMEDSAYQEWFDAVHEYEAKLQAQYPVTGMPPGEDGWRVFENKPRLGKPTGKMLKITAKF